MFFKLFIWIVEKITLTTGILQILIVHYTQRIFGWVSFSRDGNDILRAWIVSRGEAIIKRIKLFVCLFVSIFRSCSFSEWVLWNFKLYITYISYLYLFNLYWKKKQLSRIIFFAIWMYADYKCIWYLCLAMKICTLLKIDLVIFFIY